MKHFQYFDLKRYWSRRIAPHLTDPEFNRILVRDFNKFTFGRWRKEFKPGMYPEQFESCDWRCSRRGRPPDYWRYVKHSACHWLVNAALRLAMLSAPDRAWRIITSDKHSTVWDGDCTLFDLQFSALSVGPDECYQLARTRGRVLLAGEYKRTYMAQHYLEDCR